MFTFARMNDTKWSEHVILVDAEYVDKVAFDMIVNFERMLERRIPQADMAQWLEYGTVVGVRGAGWRTETH